MHVYVTGQDNGQFERRRINEVCMEVDTKEADEPEGTGSDTESDGKKKMAITESLDPRREINGNPLVEPSQIMMSYIKAIVSLYFIFFVDLVLRA